jgi:hypothetical protein
MSSLGWKRLPMKVRFLVDQLSSLKQTSIGIAFVPKAVLRLHLPDGSDTPKAAFLEHYLTVQLARNFPVRS